MPTPNSPKLIITADDYGLNDSVNKGTLAGVRKGVVSSVHVMANLVTKEAMDELIDAVNTPGIDCGIGLHLNTTWGKPLIQEKTSFTDRKRNKLFDPTDDCYYFKDLCKYDHGKTNFTEIKREFSAQFARLVQLLGSVDKIDAVSSHFNIHFWDRRFIAALNHVLGSTKIPVRSPVRWTTKGQTPQPEKYYKLRDGELPLFVKAIQVGIKVATEPTTRRLMTTAIDHAELMSLRNELESNYRLKSPVNNTGHWFGQPNWRAMEWFLKELAAVNQRRPGYSSEIFMHLANSKKGYRENYDYSMDDRVDEFEKITHPDFLQNFKALKDKLGIHHGSYRSVLNN